MNMCLVRYPRVLIEFCTKCKWNLRAAWYLQELLSTFGGDLGEVALAPAEVGIFRVLLRLNPEEQIVLWDRKREGRFPDSKELKQLVRDAVCPDRNLGHCESQITEEEDTKCTDFNVSKSPAR